MTYLDRCERLLNTPYSRLWRVDVHSPHDTTYVLALSLEHKGQAYTADTVLRRIMPDIVDPLLHIRVKTVCQMEVK